MAEKRGRKNRYETDVAPHLEQITEMARTMTEKQMADSLGIAYTTTWQNYKKEHEELKEAIKKGRQNLVSDLHSSLIKRAMGYEYTERKVTSEAVKWDEEIYLALLEAGFTLDQIARSRLVKTEVMYKQMAPDIAALNLALKNNDKTNWANDPQTLALKKKELKLREKQIEQNVW